MNRVARVFSIALLTAGLVILLDLVLTLTWSEPISAVDAWVAQRDAASQLERLEDDFQPSPHEANVADSATVRRRAAQLESRIEGREAIGRIEIPDLDLNIVLIEGTETEDLQKGPGHYPDTVLPGQRGTVAIAGHRTTYLAPFRRLDELRPADRVVIEMPYATFVYRVQRTQIVAPTQIGVVRDVGYDRVVLTACNPLYSAAQRIVVSARQVEVDPPGVDGGPGDNSVNSQLEAIDPPGLGQAVVAVLGLLAITTGMWVLTGRSGSNSTSQQSS